MHADPIILWFRRDLRLDDHPALAAAAATGRPVIPLFIHDAAEDALGAAARWRLGEALAVFAAVLAERGSRLTLRRGPVRAVLDAVIAETGARTVHWTRGYDAAARERDSAIKAGLRAAGIAAESFAGSTLREPWEVMTGAGGPYRVFTPFWRTLRAEPVPAPLPAPARLAAPGDWPGTDDLAAWAMGGAMRRGAAVIAAHAHVGAAAAEARLADFLDGAIADYPAARDLPAGPGTSGLSEPLAWGEISPRRIWHAVQRAAEMQPRIAAAAEGFLRQLAWRDFAWHLLFHFPRLDRDNWRADWDAFPWRGDNADAERWRRGMTGEPMVDAAMREMFVTGRMHNRGRMIAASYLTKHLLTDWRVGLRWFADCLTDWDPAANAMGWQWVAGSGPDAAPYFRIFNPAGQAERFDPAGAYRRAWIAEGQRAPPDSALSYFDAVPRRWGLSPGQPYPAPIIALAEGRARALSAYGAGR